MKAAKKQKVLDGVTKVRIHLRMTQEVLARYIGVSKSLISMVENGHRKLPADALEIIFNLENDMLCMDPTPENEAGKK